MALTSSRVEGLDLVVVGGGLAGSLVALASLHRRPDLRLALVEPRSRGAGHKTLSFHAADVPDDARPYVDPLVAARWPTYDVAFEGRERTLQSSYASVLSDDIDTAVASAFKRSSSATLFRQRATEVTRTTVTLDDGRVLVGATVLDARGLERHDGQPGGGYQKFVGLELALARPSPRQTPLIMDARVSQRDGFRFVYVLPFSADRVLIEDTYFSDASDLDVAAVRADVLAYAAREGYAIERIVRDESGVLPLPTRLSVEQDPAAPIKIGFAGGLFHPTTGYSFPIAVRVAELVATTPTSDFPQAFSRLLRDHASQVRYALWLNRLLFGAFAPDKRWNVLSRFYGLPERTIERFYAMTMTPGDRARILCGRPPRGMSVLRPLMGQAL